MRVRTLFDFAMARITLAGTAFLFSFTHACAASPGDTPCHYAVSRTLPFTSAASRDRLTVSISRGPCVSAKLSIVVVSSRGNVLYRYVAPFKQHVATDWDSPDLVKDAHRFVEDTASHALVPRDELPKPKPPGQAEDTDPELKVPADVYQRLISSGQPMIEHDTYYEGGRYVMFDPTTHAARVVAVWGL